MIKSMKTRVYVSKQAWLSSSEVRVWIRIKHSQNVQLLNRLEWLSPLGRFGHQNPQQTHLKNRQLDLARRLGRSICERKIGILKIKRNIFQINCLPTWHCQIDSSRSNGSIKLLSSLYQTVKLNWGSVPVEAWSMIEREWEANSHKFWWW